MKKLRVLDLFSGIGGFSLGLERAGLETVSFCENDEACQKVLRKHWPDIPIWGDIKKLKLTQSTSRDIDLICGGFPCQDISVAGKQKGIKGERSGLWKEFHRIIKEVQPRYVVIENVANLRSQGLATVLKDLWKIGYDCEWHVISARSIGAPHLRERLWVIAYKHASSSDTHNLRCWKSFTSKEEKQKWWSKATFGFSNRWEIEPSVCRMDDGLSRGLDKNRRKRIQQLGNSIVPQIAEFIGTQVLKYESTL